MIKQKFVRGLKKNFRSFLLMASLTAYSVACTHDIDIPESIYPVPANYDWWWTRHSAKVAQIIEKSHFDIIFIGDSLTHLWEDSGISEWTKISEQYDIINLGFGGDRTQNVLWRLYNGEMPKSADNVVLLIGINNIFTKNTPNDTDKGIKAIIGLLRRRIPGVRILLLSIPPVYNANLNDGNTDIAKVNAKISAYDSIENVDYIDFSSEFFDDNGNLKPEMYDSSQVHFSSAVYAKERELIMNAISKKNRSSK